MATILLGKQFPQDPHLYMCLVQWGAAKYSTHIYDDETGGLSLGHYFEASFGAARAALTTHPELFSSVLRDFSERCATYAVTLDAKQIINKEV